MRPFSSTAVVEFVEPASVGGVPIIKYKVEWRLPGQEWTSAEYRAEDGEWRSAAIPAGLSGLGSQKKRVSVEHPAATESPFYPEALEKNCLLISVFFVF